MWFLFRLSLAMGWPDPWQLEKKLKSKTITQWLAFDQLEPIGPRLTNWIGASQAAMFANAHFKTDNPLGPGDFLPGGISNKKNQKARDTYGKFKTWALTHQEVKQ